MDIAWAEPRLLLVLRSARGRASELSSSTTRAPGAGGNRGKKCKEADGVTKATLKRPTSGAAAPSSRVDSNSQRETMSRQPCDDSKTAVGGPGCGRLVAAAAATASLSGLMLGYEMGLTSGVLLQLRGVLSLSCRQQELLVSSQLLGALLVCLAGGPVLDRYGRRRSLLLSAALVVAGTLPLVAAASLAALASGRAAVGMGTSLSGTAACLYIAEISPRERRGLLVTLYELMLVLGVMLGFGCSCAFAATPRGWAYTFGLVIPAALLQMGALAFLPPSPRFLVARGQPQRAREVLARLRGGAEERVEEELREIQMGLKEESERSFAELFGAKSNLRSRLLTGAALVFLQQATGQPNILSYASPLLRGVGFRSDAAATLASTGFGAVKVAGTIPAVLLVDRVGPKSFLCAGAAGMGVSLAALGALTLHSRTHLSSLCVSQLPSNRSGAWRDADAADASPTLVPGTPVWRTDGDNGTLRSGPADRHSSWLKWASLFSLLAFVAAFSIGLGPMVYVVVSEIFPAGIRGRAVSAVSAVNWATNLLMSMTFLTVTEKVGVPTMMFLYAALSFVLLVFVILCVPDTRGRTLEEISKELAKKKHFEFSLCKKVQNPARGGTSGEMAANIL
ncbi:solute carrier family 2, facilitated glucose transporter member 12 isoform X1 [Hippocampus zosterae]|uniref:solute carrier family 2, facilitated glucose transporter member 12 isoform X1 n=1 Tax=Hippocampus zosterae TaxID=109293 RepID=UPI00223DD354|nr:solute carrier family 2, facilitated glucose transporter member 12 isoform X1 [Hippocampus zosterae]